MSAPSNLRQIPLSSPSITQREIDAVVEVMRSGVLSLGPKVEEFEAKCAAVAGREHGIAVSSGTAGLHCAVLAAGIGEGDEVLTTPFSFVASANPIMMAGATPKFVDVEPSSFNLDPKLLEAAITPRTKAIMAVEVFGHPGGMEEIEAIARRNELILLEDCCEGFGGSVQTATGTRKIGSFGRAGVFGFYPNKQITTGEGGMIVTDDKRIADLARSLRNQGRDGMAWLAHQRMGYNYRLSEINSALGCVQVDRLDDILAARRDAAGWYMQRLLDSPYMILPTLGNHEAASWFVFVVRLTDLFEPGDRDEVIRQLRLRGIGSNNYFPPIHLQPYMAERFGYAPGTFPVAEYVSERTIALPFYAGISQQQVDRVCKELGDVLEGVLLSRKRS